MSDEIKPRGAPIEAAASMAKYRAMRAELDAKVASGELTIQEAEIARKNFGSNLIAHERDQRDAGKEIGPAIDPMSTPPEK